MQTLQVRSPCVSVCALGADGLCLGCYRTIEEIAGWSRMSDAERLTVLQRLGERARIRGR